MVQPLETGGVGIYTKLSLKSFQVHLVSHYFGNGPSFLSPYPLEGI